MEEALELLRQEDSCVSVNSECPLEAASDYR